MPLIIKRHEIAVLIVYFLVDKLRELPGDVP